MINANQKVEYFVLFMYSACTFKELKTIYFICFYKSCLFLEYFSPLLVDFLAHNPSIMIENWLFFSYNSLLCQEGVK